MQMFMTAQTIPVSFPSAMPALFVPVGTRKTEIPKSKRGPKATTKPVRLVTKPHPTGNKAPAIQVVPISPLND